MTPVLDRKIAGKWVFYQPGSRKTRTPIREVKLANIPPDSVPYPRVQHREAMIGVAMVVVMSGYGPYQHHYIPLGRCVCRLKIIRTYAWYPGAKE